MFSRGLLAAAMAVAMCSPAAAAGYGASPITMRHLNLEPGQWSGPVIQEEILTGHRLFLRNAGDALQGFKKKVAQWPTISNNRQTLADAAPGAATLQGANAEEGQAPGLRPAASTMLKVHPIKGDGRCMFRSISRALAHTQDRPLTERMETKDADALRGAAYNVICVDKREAFEQARVIEGDMGSYCTRMKSSDFFGGEPELFVIAEELQQAITVYVPHQGGFKPIVEYGSKYLNDRPRIRILYNGNNHYDALLDQSVFDALLDQSGTQGYLAQNKATPLGPYSRPTLYAQGGRSRIRILYNGNNHYDALLDQSVFDALLDQSGTLSAILTLKESENR